MHRAEARYSLPSSDSELVRRYGPLIERVGRRLAARVGLGHLVDELWSTGALGLLEAARRFEPGRGVRFETFAEHRIRGAMLDELRKMDHLPRRLRADTERVDRGRAALTGQLGREPSADELAQHLGMPIDALAELEQLRQPLLPLVDALAVAGGAEGADARVERTQAVQQLTAAISTLDERLQRVLALYYVEELTFREIAGLLEVSEGRVCQLHGEAVKRLRAALANAEEGALAPARPPSPDGQRAATAASSSRA
ncbi:MAG: FliA/WhiG family RNA polymerase sigma factor [Myxococcota bacterium]|jgi:RNA polymerase sigma factor for flagellar operon FliA